MISLLMLAAFIILMGTAAVSDLSTYRIPNRLVLTIALLFILAAPLAGMPLEIAFWHLLAGVLLFVLGYGLFSLGMIGGGDAKLVAAAALWVGWTALPHFLLYTALAGGLLAFAMLIWEFIRMHVELTAANPESSLIKRIAALKPDLPYGVAIAVGACAALARSWWASSLPVNI
jgi:prepilin peptidase CpaA